MSAKILAIGVVSVVGKGDLAIYRSSIDQLKNLGTVKLCLPGHTFDDFASRFFSDIDLLPHPYEITLPRNLYNQSLLRGKDFSKPMYELARICDKSFLMRQLVIPIATRNLVNQLYPYFKEIDLAVVLGHTLSLGFEDWILNCFLRSYFYPKFVLRKPTVILPFSISQLGLKSSSKKSIPLIKMALRNIDVIFLREQLSYETLIRLIGVRQNILQAADTAFLLSDANITNVNSKIDLKIDAQKTAVGVVLRSDYFHVYETRYGPAVYHLFMKKVAKLLDRIIKNYDTSIYFIPMTVVPCSSTFDDLDCAQECITHMKNQSDAYIINTFWMSANEIKTLISLMDFLITMRLHSGIMSVSKYVPTVMILPVQDNKAISIAERLGIKEYFIDLDYAIETNPNNLYSIISKALKNHDAIQDILKITVPREQKLAARPFQVLKSMLK